MIVMTQRRSILITFEKLSGILSIIVGDADSKEDHFWETYTSTYEKIAAFYAYFEDFESKEDLSSA